uniref:Uncharacterized protein n=1 Tax=Triticum urartu TaxID=4572 RepID=A0A8R7TW79_TRIUA
AAAWRAELDRGASPRPRPYSRRHLPRRLPLLPTGRYRSAPPPNATLPAPRAPTPSALPVTRSLQQCPPDGPRRPSPPSPRRTRRLPIRNQGTRQRAPGGPRQPSPQSPCCTRRLPNPQPGNTSRIFSHAAAAPEVFHLSDAHLYCRVYSHQAVLNFKMISTFIFLVIGCCQEFHHTHYFPTEVVSASTLQPCTSVVTYISSMRSCFSMPHEDAVITSLSSLQVFLIVMLTP